MSLCRAVVAPSAPASIAISPLGVRIGLEHVAFEATELLEPLSFRQGFVSDWRGQIQVDTPQRRTVLRSKREISVSACVTTVAQLSEMDKRWRGGRLSRNGRTSVPLRDDAAATEEQGIPAQ